MQDSFSSQEKQALISKICTENSSDHPEILKIKRKIAKLMQHEIDYTFSVRLPYISRLGHLLGHP